MKSHHRFAVELFDEAGTSLGQTPVEVDWEPAGECARFAAVRAGRLDLETGNPTLTVSPVWHHQLGEPYASGFRVLLGDAGEPVGEAFSSVYFRAQADKVASALVSEGRLHEGDRYHYLLVAFPIADAEAVPPPPFHVQDVSPPLPLTAGSLGAALSASLPHGEVSAADLPVFVPNVVLAEAAALARRAHDRETGGVLVGYLHRDPDDGTVFVMVTAQIPATLAEGGATNLEFTPDTWTQVSGLLALRRRQTPQPETFAGWWHSHPVHSWSGACRDCPVEKRRVCPMASGFFSAQDRALHRAVFPRAYTVALVVNQIAEQEQTFSLFGWRQGLIQARGFHVLNGLPTLPAPTPGTPG